MSENDKQEFGEKFRDDIKRDIHERIRARMDERFNARMNRPKVMLVGDVHWGSAWGLIIVIVGVGLLLRQMGVLPFNPVARFWPVLLIAFGIMNLATHSGRFFGFLLILAGAVFQLNILGYTHLTFADLWPIILIALGVLLMWASLETRGFIRKRKQKLDDLRERITNPPDLPAGALNAVAVFGGCERRISSKNFQGGRATAVFGGVELDFRDADIESEAILEVNCVFGGVEIRVPETWNVHSRNVPVFGGYEDTSRQPSETPGAKPKTLIVTGMVVFGGVEIKN